MNLLTLILLIAAIVLLYQVWGAYQGMRAELRELRTKCSATTAAATTVAPTTVSSAASAPSTSGVTTSLVETLQKMLLMTQGI